MMGKTKAQLAVTLVLKSHLSRFKEQEEIRKGLRCVDILPSFFVFDFLLLLCLQENFIPMTTGFRF